MSIEPLSAGQQERKVSSAFLLVIGAVSALQIIAHAGELRLDILAVRFVACDDWWR